MFWEKQNIYFKKWTSVEKESETSWGSGSGRPVTDMRRGNAWQEEGRQMWSFLCTRISYQFSKEKKKKGQPVFKFSNEQNSTVLNGALTVSDIIKFSFVMNSIS
jgi:hypothetical protein